MSEELGSIESVVERFLEHLRAGASADVASFARQHPHLGSELVAALEAAQFLEAARLERGAGHGERVGPFLIRGELGRGAMGVVWEAVEEPLGRHVALKLLPAELFGSAAARARFEREARLASRLDHPGICTVYGAGVSGGRPWIAMRLVPGSTLAERIAADRERGGSDGGIPSQSRERPLEIARCIARVARALASAHACGVLHRDIKPSNVMVTPTGEPVLLDFGIAAATDGEASELTRTGETAGTPGYLAPELIAGEVPRPDALCDVYALGVTLYECLALRRPFQGPTRESVYRAILAGSPPDVRRFDPRVPPDLWMAVSTALERDRTRRYAGAELLAEDLEACVAGRPIAARPVRLLGRVARWARREPRQAVLSVATAAAALALAVSGGMLIASRDALQAGRQAQRTSEIEASLAEAFSQWGSRSYEVADATFQRILALDPGNEDALVGSVLARLRLQRNEDALELLRSAPQTPSFDGLRALAAGVPVPAEDPHWLQTAPAFELFVDGERLRFEAEGRPHSERVEWMRKALARYDEAVLRAPQARMLYHQLRVLAAAEAKDEAATRSSCAALANLWPDSGRALYQAGSALVDFDPAAARSLLDRSIALEPEYSATWQCLGIAHLRLESFEQARAAFERAVALRPGSAPSWNGLGVTLGALGCPDEQRAALLCAIAADPRQVQPWANLGLLEQQSGRAAEAIQAWETLLELDPALGAYRQVLSQLHHKQGDPDQACAEAEINVVWFPEDPLKWGWYAGLLLELDRPRQALEAVAAAQAFAPELAALEELADQARAALAHEK